MATKILNARTGAEDNLHLFKNLKKRAGDPVRSFAVSPSPIAPVTSPYISDVLLHLDDMDASGNFTASRDADNDFDFDASARHFKDHGVVHVRGAADTDESVGRITSTHVDRKARRITVTGTIHHDGARKKIAEGVQTHLAFRTKRASNGGRLPTRAHLSDSRHPHETSKLMRLAKADGSVVKVAPRGPGGDVAVGTLAKGAALDPFKRIFAQPPKRGLV